MTNGGSIARQLTINSLLAKGFNLVIIVPSHEDENSILNKNIIYTPINVKTTKLFLYLERLGFISDYLSPWVKRSFKSLKNIIHEDDIVLSTSGGELGCIMLGNMLKNSSGCRHIINLHDPILYTKIEHIFIGDKLHVNRTKKTFIELSQAESIITSSKNLQTALIKLLKKNTVFNMYFGFSPTVAVTQKSFVPKVFNVVYAGAMGKYQKPEILLDYIEDFNFNLTYIGDYKSNRVLNRFSKSKRKNLRSVNFIEYMNNKDLNQYLLENADYLFVSLSKEYLKYSFPSKIYTAINLEIPIIGHLPEGYAKEFIELKDIGSVSSLNTISLTDSLKKALNIVNYANFKKNIQKIKPKFSNEVTMSNLSSILLSSSRSIK